MRFFDSEDEEYEENKSAKKAKNNNVYSDIGGDPGNVSEEPEKDTCDICEAEISFFNRHKVVRDFYICGGCAEKSAIERHIKEVKNLPPDEIRKIIIAKMKKADMFTTTDSADKYLFIDGNRKLWTVPYLTGFTRNKPNIDPALIFPISVIKDYEFIEDGKTIAKGGKGMEPIGGLLFAGGGAGGVRSKVEEKCKQMEIKIRINDLTIPAVYIDLIRKPVEKGTNRYNAAYINAQKILSMFEMVCHSQDEPEIERNTERRSSVFSGTFGDASGRRSEKIFRDGSSGAQEGPFRSSQLERQRTGYVKEAEDDLLAKELGRSVRDISAEDDEEEIDGTRVYRAESLQKRVAQRLKEMEMTGASGPEVRDKKPEERNNMSGREESTYDMTHTTVTEAIKKYKELLDMGAITQEEYDSKKRQLLNL